MNYTMIGEHGDRMKCQVMNSVVTFKKITLFPSEGYEESQQTKVLFTLEEYDKAVSRYIDASHLSQVIQMVVAPQLYM